MICLRIVNCVCLACYCCLRSDWIGVCVYELVVCLVFWLSDVICVAVWVVGVLWFTTVVWLFDFIWLFFVVFGIWYLLW